MILFKKIDLYIFSTPASTNSPVNEDKKRFEITKGQGKFILGNFVYFEVVMKTLSLRPWQAAAVAAILKK